MNFEYICVYIRIYIYVINQTNAIIRKKVPYRMIDRIDVAS